MRQENIKPIGSSKLPATRRVLVPFTFARWGGVRSILATAIPRLSVASNLAIEYAELCGNDADMDEMETCGIRVNRALGVPGKGVLSVRRGVGRWLDLLFASPLVARLVARLRAGLRRYDVVYVQLFRDLFVVFLALATMSPKRRPLVVWHCHGIGERGAPYLMRSCANRCEAVVAVSRDVAERLDELGVHKWLVRVISNAVDAEEIQASADRWKGELPLKTEGQMTLLVPVAALRHAKGVHIAVKALRELPSHVVLWVTGKPEDLESTRYNHELQQLIEKGGLHRRVHFLGLRRDIYGVMSHADVIVVPSVWREPFGLVAAEAMALERPVVVSDRGALPEVVDHGNAGAVFDPGVEGSLSGCIADILANPAAARQRAVNGLWRVTNVFRYDRWVREIAEVLKSPPKRRQRWLPRSSESRAAIRWGP
jgi:glycosyltransferase involved in cell wall biosynthesis